MTDEREAPATPDEREAPAARVDILRYRGDATLSAEGEVAVERPLAIRVAGQTLAITMRTPGNDRELAIGFLASEGWLTHRDRIVDIGRTTPPDGTESADGIDVSLRDVDATRAAAGLRRGSLATSSCGVCGRTTLDDLLERCAPVDDRSPWGASMVRGLTTRLSELQPVFARTGGLHAAAVVARDALGTFAFEDVGRHNAVDKALGHAVLSDLLPLRGRALVVSGRTSFEIVQKASVAGVPVVASVSAPSSLAIDLARRLGITLVGFARGDHFDVYAGAERIVP